MKTITFETIAETVADLCVQACTELPGVLRECLKCRATAEPYAPARDTLRLMGENADTARRTGLPICQDTGMTVVFAELGQEVHITGGLLEEAIHEGVRRGYTRGYLRKSVVKDPLRRVNTGDNTPAMVHIRLVRGDALRLTVSPKGAGSENMSRLAMLTPAQGIAGVEDFVVDSVRRAGANPCPPMVVGVGIGGNFEGVALLAKEALARLREGPHPDPFYEEMEQRLLKRVNDLGIGPQGFGGETTALMVRIQAAPTHIASLPVAVNIGCHVTRHAEATLKGVEEA